MAKKKPVEMSAVISFKCEQEMHDKLEEIADNNDRSMSEEARRAIRNHIQKDEKIRNLR